MFSPLGALKLTSLLTPPVPGVWTWAVTLHTFCLVEPSCLYCLFSIEAVEMNGMEEEDEDDEDEVVFEEEKMEAEPQIDLKEAEDGGTENMAGSSHQPGPSQPPDEEQAGLEIFHFNTKKQRTFLFTTELVPVCLLIYLTCFHLQVPVV